MGVTGLKQGAGGLGPESADLYYALVDGAREYAIFAMDLDGRIATWNRGAARIMGWSEAEIVGRPASTIFTPEDVAAAAPERELRTAAEQGRSEDRRWHMRKDGSRFWADGMLEPLRDERGSIRGFFKILRDETESHRMGQEVRAVGEALHASEARYRALFDSIDSGFCVIEVLFDDTGRSVDYRFLEVNPAFERQTGMKNAEGRRMREFAPRHEEHWFEIYGRIALTGEPLRFENRAEQLGRFYDVYAFRVGDPQARQVAILFNDITERRRDEAERERLLARESELRAQAEAVSRATDEFLATVSHELRTPLTSMLGWSTLLRSGSLDAAATERATVTIDRNVRAQAKLIDDLLDVSRIISGKLRLDVRPVDPGEVINAAADSIRPAAEAKGIGLRVTLDPDAGLVAADPDRLQQVVWNLVSNAVKFTSRGGDVELRLERCGEQARIVVSDTGQGIAPEFLPHVFDRFRQADSSTKRRFGGLGLGLAIVHQLVEMHGGTVAVESEGEGRGATFTVSLPLVPVRGEETVSKPRASAASRGVFELDCPPTLERLRVLVVDDEQDARDIIAHVLGRCGAEVLAVGTADAALEQIASFGPDVLVSDIGMPDRDGYDLIREVRRLAPESGGAVPAVALTAYAGVKYRDRALESGYQVHVPKPIEPAELVAVVATLAVWNREGGRDR
jgi:PAS domain S-box-containing protein